MQGVVTHIEKNAIYYDIDTSSGQSGAGITTLNEANVLEAYGVHTSGTKNPIVGNEGVRLDGELLTFLRDFMNSKT